MVGQLPCVALNLGQLLARRSPHRTATHPTRTLGQLPGDQFHDDIARDTALTRMTFPIPLCMVLFAIHGDALIWHGLATIKELPRPVSRQTMAANAKGIIPKHHIFALDNVFLSHRR